MLALSVLPKFNMDVYVYNYGLFVISQPCVDLAMLNAPPRTLDNKKWAGWQQL